MIIFGTNISRHNWPSNDQLSSHLTKSLFLRYLRKTEQAKYCILFNAVWLLD